MPAVSLNAMWQDGGDVRLWRISGTEGTVAQPKPSWYQKFDHANGNDRRR